MLKTKPIIAITMGDPAGVGPEITVRSLAEKKVFDMCRSVVVGDARVMWKACDITGVDLDLRIITDVSDAQFDYGVMNVIDLHNVEIQNLIYGRISAIAGNAAFESIKKVIELALAGKVDATVTGPIHKESLNLAGHHYSGHTEIYAHFTGSKNVAMLLVDGAFRVIHVSTHVSLRKACDLVKKERVLEVIKLLYDACRTFGTEKPRIAVTGLNPHASDGGLFGHEEEEEILPAIKEARQLGIDVRGPIPADTIYSMAAGGVYDGCVAMYHDQGHIPFKLRGFVWDNNTGSWGKIRGVNITLGIPIIRTSVDHGTAFDIAGTGTADHSSMIQAIEYAVQMASGRTEGAATLRNSGHR
jgi:4-phospho-D-threonate 3-dehydrogenase / 4-phospho-D-erythronate 3-dehydrogenase